jgi:hypothetical protein
MTAPAPVPAPDPGPMTLERLVRRWRKLLRGPDAEKVLAIMILDARQYAAHMIEQCARPDDRWEPQ